MLLTEFFQQENVMYHTAHLKPTTLCRIFPMCYVSLPNHKVWMIFSIYGTVYQSKLVRQRQSPSQTLDQRRQMLPQKWRAIQRNNIRTLVSSMPRRCEYSGSLEVVIQGTNLNGSQITSNCDKLFVIHRQRKNWLFSSHSKIFWVNILISSWNFFIQSTWVSVFLKEYIYRYENSILFTYISAWHNIIGL